MQTDRYPHLQCFVVVLRVIVLVGMRSARQTGAMLLLTPLLIIAGISYFPSYDARPGRFVGSFDNIVAAGGRYLVSLILFIVVAVLLGFLSFGLARGDIRNSASAMWVVIVGLGVSSVGFLVAGLTGLPVYNWAAIAAEGSGSVIEMASRSESLATTSQTMLLMFGLGGLLISMSVLGVVAVVRRWTPVWAFVVTVVIAAVLVVVGVIIEGPVFWLALGVLPLLWALAFGLILLIRGRFNPTTIHTHT